MRRKCLARRMRRDALTDSGAAPSVLACLSQYVIRTHRLIWEVHWKQPVPWSADAPVGLQNLNNWNANDAVAVGKLLTLDVVLVNGVMLHGWQDFRRAYAQQFAGHHVARFPTNRRPSHRICRAGRPSPTDAT